LPFSVFSVFDWSFVVRNAMGERCSEGAGAGPLERLLAVEDGLGVCWIGNAGWLVRSEGKLIAFDPDLDPGGLRVEPPPLTAEELAPVLDAVFITHEHGDHFNDHTGRVLAGKSDCLFVLPANCIEKASRLGIPVDRVRLARPGQAMQVAGARVQPLRALHGHKGFTIYSGANLDDCGYLVEIAGRRVLHPGESVLLEEHLGLGPVDVLFVSPTEHNMHVERSVDFIRALDPVHIFPQHFGTYRVTEDNSFWTIGYPDELEAALPDKLKQRYHKLRQGGVFVVQ
jgi:L-ascorbate metabolism protein UlaG (beta-lactamase superfamily)